MRTFGPWATPLALAILLLPAQWLDFGLMAALTSAAAPRGPSTGLVLLVASSLEPADAERLRAAGAGAIRLAGPPTDNRLALDGGLYRRLPASLMRAPTSAQAFIDWRGTIDSGAFLAYDPDDLRAGRIPAGALAGRTVLVGPRGTGLAGMVATPIGPMTSLELEANALDCAERGRPYRALGLDAQLLLLLAPLALAWRVPGLPAYRWLAAAAFVAACIAAAFWHLLPGLYASTAGWLTAALLTSRSRAATLEKLLAAGKPQEALSACGPGDEYFAARALVLLGRPGEVEALLAKADLHAFPADDGARLAEKLEQAGHDGPALALLEWAIASGGPSSALSRRATELRSRREGLKGLLGLEGIQRLLSGRYERAELLGQGGMGIVLSAWDSYLEKPVAIKVLNPTLLSDPSARGRFRREVETMMRLNHPNIVEIHAVHSEDLLYFAMERLEGMSVHEALQRNPTAVDREKVLRVVAECLAHCHEQGILHRDVKADNVFLLSDGRVKLIDFGVARAIGGTDLTAAGEVVGTLCYLAPELFSGGAAGPQTDIFAYGVMAYELYAGRLPFSHPLAAAPVEPVPAMPEAIARVTSRCLQRDPAARYASFAEVLRDLPAPAGGAQFFEIPG